MQRFISVLLRIAVWLTVAAAQSGCSTIYNHLLDQKKGAFDPSVLNSFRLTSSDGTYTLVSLARIQTPPFHSNDVWSTIDTFIASGVKVEIQAPKEFAQSTASFLYTRRAGCQTASDELISSLSLAYGLLHSWSPKTMEDLIVVFRMTPPNRGTLIHEISAQSRISELRLYLLGTTIDAPQCINIKYWALDLSATAMHETAHIYAYQRFGPSLDDLDNEFMASSTEACLRLSATGTLPRRWVLTPGLDFDRDHLMDDPRFNDMYRTGQMSASMAGKLLADSMREATFARDLSEKDSMAMNEICRRVFETRPDVRNKQYLSRVYQIQP